MDRLPTAQHREVAGYIHHCNLAVAGRARVIFLDWCLSHKEWGRIVIRSCLRDLQAASITNKVVMNDAFLVRLFTEKVLIVNGFHRGLPFFIMHGVREQI